MIFTAEIVASTDSGGTTTTLYYSTRGFATGASDTPASTHFAERLLAPGNYQRSMGSGRSLLGAVSAAFGEIVLMNTDGELDDLLDYSIGRRSITVRVASSHPGTYPTGWTTLYVATGESMVADGTVIRIVLRDPWSKLNGVVCDTFAGTGDYEGDAALAGTPKPVVFGRVFNCPLTLIEAAYNIYLAGTQPKSWCKSVRDNGALVTQEVVSTGYEDITGLTSLRAYAISAGCWVSADNSTLRLETIGGEITADVWTFTTSYTDADARSTARAGTLINVVATAAGLAGAEISSSDVTALNSALLTDLGTYNEGAFGYYVKDLTTTYAQVVAAIAQSARAWVGFDRTGVLRFARLSDTLGTSVYTFTPNNARELRRVLSDEPGRGVPIKTARVRYAKNWTQQNASSLDAAVDADIAAEYAEDYARVAEDSNSVGTQFLNAGELTIDAPASFAYRGTTNGDLEHSAVDSAMDTIDASVILDLWGATRKWLTLTAPFTLDQVTTIDLGSVVTVEWPRFGLDAGADFRVAGIRYQLTDRARSIVYTLVG